MLFRSGTTTLQVSLEQLRGAYGFEQWQPSIEDINMLRNATSNIRQDLWQDHRTTAPPQDEDEYNYPLEYLPQPTTTISEPPQPVLPLAPPQEQTQQPSIKTDLQAPQLTLQQQQQNTTTENINIFSPTHIQVTTRPPTTTQSRHETTRRITDLDYNANRYGLTRRARSRTPTGRAPRTPTNRATSQPATPRATPQTQRTIPITDNAGTRQQEQQLVQYESA